MFTNVTLPTTTLTGTNLTLQTTAQTQWVAQDARGTGNGWSITIAVEGALTSGAGTFDTTPRTIAASNLTFAPGTVTALSGSDPTTNITTSNLTLSTSAQTFLSCSSMCKGRYGFHPTVTLAVPANAYRSNFTGAVNASALNPYTATLVFTIS